MVPRTVDGYERLALFIDGQWRQGSAGKSEPVINPATEDVLGVLPHASKDDLDEALAAAQRGFDVWRKTNAIDRARILRTVADLMLANIDSLARIATLEQGKPLHEAKLEIISTAEGLEWLGEEAKRINGKVLPRTRS